MLASRSGGNFSILEAVLESHFWGGVKSDLFTGLVFFMHGEEKLGRYTNLHSGLQSNLGAQCRDEMGPDVFSIPKNHKTCPLQPVVAGDRELTPLFVTCSSCQ